MNNTDGNKYEHKERQTNLSILRLFYVLREKNGWILNSGVKSIQIP